MKTKTNKNRYAHIITAFLLITYISIWSTLYMSTHLDVDIAWLLQCLERFIDGGTYTDDFYETNPPLSFLIYLPAYPLFNTLGLSPKISVLILFMLYIMASNAVLFKLLQKTALSQTIILVICCAAISGQTWGAGTGFGLKDHLILIFLTPFTLLQYVLTTTSKNEIPTTIRMSATIMGGVALCLKPHYAIIPAFMYLHRLVTTKSIKRCIISIDSIGLALCGSLYIAFIYLFTPTFVETILPETIRLYKIDVPFPVTMHLKLFAITVISIFIGYALLVISKGREQIETQKAIIGFSILSALCVAPYIIQNKGFLYQTTPFLGFGVAALTMAVYGICRLMTKKQTTALLVTFVLIGVLTHMNTTNSSSAIMNNNQFKSQPIAEYIEENAWNNVYITYDMKSMLSPLPYLLDVENGSRFGQIWNLHALSLLQSRAQKDEERDAIKSQMLVIIDMMAEDIRRSEPSVIAIPLYPTDRTTYEPSQMYYKFLMANENFAKAMQNYEKDARIPFNKKLSMNKASEGDIIWHDMYIRNKSNNNQ